MESPNYKTFNPNRANEVRHLNGAVGTSGGKEFKPNKKRTFTSIHSTNGNPFVRNDFRVVNGVKCF
jgi:hypothetical protein